MLAISPDGRWLASAGDGNIVVQEGIITTPNIELTIVLFL